MMRPPQYGRRPGLPNNILPMSKIAELEVTRKLIFHKYNPEIYMQIRQHRTGSVRELSTNIKKANPINLVAKGVKQEKLPIQIP